MNYEFLKPLWEDYELLDSGDGEKLERWGRQITLRPEPQAVWHKSFPEGEWERRATAVFRRQGQSEEQGKWNIAKDSPEQWTIEYKLGIRNYELGIETGSAQQKQVKDSACRLVFRLGLTSFKHVGLFPEQAANWEWIFDKVRKRVDAKLTAKPNVLNLFAYTGGASLVAAQAGAEVVHVDSVRAVVGWAKQNAVLTEVDGIHWITEDASKFTAREVRRGRLYDGIILDPPAYGRGAEGEKWILERDIAPLLANCARILKPDGFVVLNLYSMGLSALVAGTLVHQIFGAFREEQFGELYVEDRAQKRLPLGVFWRGEK